MAQALIFHSAEDGESLRALLSGLDGLSVLSIPGPVPAGVQFGSRVIVAWSRHAAAAFNAEAGAPNLPRNSVVVRLDDTPLPLIYGSGVRAVAAMGDGADALRLKTALTSGPSALAGVASGRARVGPARRLAAPLDRAPAQPPRREKLTRFKVASRRRAQTAFMVLSASTFGTLSAWGLGSAVPADALVTPSFASGLLAAPADAMVRHEHLAETRQIAGAATFQGMAAPSEGAITFSADEMQSLTQSLDHAETAMVGIRVWSDGVINRLQGLASRAPEAMPIMAPAPLVRASPEAATASASGPALSQGAFSPELVVLRDRFAQVEPMVHAVDRVGELASAAPTASRDRGG